MILFLAGCGAMLALVWGVFALTGFRAQRASDYADGPKFDIREHLNGPLICEGILYGPTGRVTSRFTARMHGEWTGDTGVLTEQFVYESGMIQNREWRLQLDQAGRITAQADDLIGDCVGQQSGNAVQLSYQIVLPADAGGHSLMVTDWMYRLECGTIMNRSQFRKFGIKVAELVATMRPDTAPQTRKFEDVE